MPFLVLYLDMRTGLLEPSALKLPALRAADILDTSSKAKVSPLQRMKDTALILYRLSLPMSDARMANAETRQLLLDDDVGLPFVN